MGRTKPGFRRTVSLFRLPIAAGPCDGVERLPELELPAALGGAHYQLGRPEHAYVGTAKRTQLVNAIDGGSQKSQIDHYQIETQIQILKKNLYTTYLSFYLTFLSDFFVFSPIDVFCNLLRT